MNLSFQKAFNDATNGGLDILRYYINTNFTINETHNVKTLDKRFKVHFSQKYSNYVVSIEDWSGIIWEKAKNYNAIWYVKELFQISESQAYEKIEYDLELGLLSKLKDGSYLDENNLKIETKQENQGLKRLNL